MCTKILQIQFRFVNPVQITVASFSSPLHPPLWNSSSEAITPRWRILDVITSICRFFYSHCEVTCRLPLTSPHNGQLLSTHQSLWAEDFDTLNLGEIIPFDNLDNSINLFMCVVGTHCVSSVHVPLSVLCCVNLKTAKCTECNFHKLCTYTVVYTLEELLLIYHLIQILCLGYWFSFKDSHVSPDVLSWSCLSFFQMGKHRWRKLTYGMEVSASLPSDCIHFS